VFAEIFCYVELETLISLLEVLFGLEAANKIPSVCSITRTMDRNLFWTRLNTLAGDLGFLG
jgi:hypothetical protein